MSDTKPGPEGRMTSALPPWQSMHASCTVPVVCMLGASVNPWQETHPALLRAASSCDCPGDCPGSNANAANRISPPATAAIEMYLETETDISCHRKQSLVSKDIAEALHRGERVECARNRHVFAERRAVYQAES